MEAQEADKSRPHLLTSAELENALTKPECLQGYRPAQTGPLINLESPEGAQPDTTYLVEPKRFQSEGFMINGWLYLPEEGDRFPLVVLTNGGGGDERPIKSLSDFIAPVLAHCGVAAFVHDKRGTGGSEGVFRDTDYEDYINDTGHAARFLSRDPRFEGQPVGVLGGSEGGRIAVLAASRFSEFDFVVSLMGPTINMVDDRLLAEKHGRESRGLDGVEWEAIEPIWRGLMEAFAAGDSASFAEADERIRTAREVYPRRVLPFTSTEILANPASDDFLPTWTSLKYDYVTEMETFRKPWFAIFGAEDGIVPAEPNVQEIHRTTALSGNPDVSITVFPRVGHAPVDSETGRRVLFENPILNWMWERGFAPEVGNRKGVGSFLPSSNSGD